MTKSTHANKIQSLNSLLTKYDPVEYFIGVFIAFFTYSIHCGASRPHPDATHAVPFHFLSPGQKNALWSVPIGPSLGCAHTHSEVKTSFQTRYRHWCKEVKIKGKQSASDFNTRLSRKQHAGTLNFNHDEEKLSLEARPPRTAPSLCPPLPPPPPPTALAACSLRRWRATRRTRRPRPRPTRAA